MKISFKDIKHSFLSLLFLILGLTFIIGYQMARENRDEFYSDTITTTATIESIEGSFMKGRKVKETYYNYWIVFDAYRFHYQWPEKYNVGESFQVAYNPDRPSVMKPLTRIESNKSSEWKIFIGFGIIVPIIFFWLSYYNYREFKWHHKQVN